MTERKIKTRKTRKRQIKKGGFFSYFFGKKNTDISNPSSNSNLESQNSPLIPKKNNCDPLELPSIKNVKDLHAKYQQCCPKTFFGRKNTSPYCKQVDLNYQAQLKADNDANEYAGYEPDEFFYKRLEDGSIKVPNPRPNNPDMGLQGGRKNKTGRINKTGSKYNIYYGII